MFLVAAGVLVYLVVSAGGSAESEAAQLAKRFESPGNFVSQVKKTVAAELPHLSKASAQLLCAHLAYESGWGKGAPTRYGWNLGNITAGPAWRGATWAVEDADDEYDELGNRKRISQVWRVYGSLNESIRDYWAFLGGPRYIGARVVLEGAGTKISPDTFAAALRSGGYFTLPLGRYQIGLNGVLARVVREWELYSFV